MGYTNFSNSNAAPLGPACLSPSRICAPSFHGGNLAYNAVKASRMRMSHVTHTAHKTVSELLGLTMKNEPKNARLVFMFCLFLIYTKDTQRTGSSVTRSRFLCSLSVYLSSSFAIHWSLFICVRAVLVSCHLQRFNFIS